MNGPRAITDKEIKRLRQRRDVYEWDSEQYSVARGCVYGIVFGGFIWTTALVVWWMIKS